MMLKIVVFLLPLRALCATSYYTYGVLIARHRNSNGTIGSVLESASQEAIYRRQFRRSVAVCHETCSSEEECVFHDGRPECVCKVNFIQGYLGCLECDCPSDSNCTLQEDDGNEIAVCVCEQGYYFEDKICKEDENHATLRKTDDPIANLKTTEDPITIRNTTESFVTLLITTEDFVPIIKTHDISVQIQKTSEDLMTPESSSISSSEITGPLTPSTEKAKDANLTADSCNPSPCVNGKCSEFGEKRYYCNCEPQYIGINCSEENMAWKKANGVYAINIAVVGVVLGSALLISALFSIYKFRSLRRTRKDISELGLCSNEAEVCYAEI